MLVRYAGAFVLVKIGESRRFEFGARKQTHQPVVVDAEALAGRRFEALAIDDREFPVMVANEPRALKLAGGFGDPGAPHAEHRRQELVRHRQNVALQPVTRHEQPTGATLLDGVKAVASGGLSTQVEESLDEGQHDSANRGTLIEGRLAFGHLHPQRGAGNLDNDLLGGQLAAQKSGHSDDTLHPDHADFDRRAVRHARQDGGHSLLDEVNIFERGASLTEHLP